MQKAKDKYNGGGKAKAAEYCKNKTFWRKMQGIYPETYLKRKNKQKELMEEIDTDTWQKMKNRLKEYQKN